MRAKVSWSDVSIPYVVTTMSAAPIRSEHVSTAATYHTSASRKHGSAVSVTESSASANGSSASMNGSSASINRSRPADAARLLIRSSRCPTAPGHSFPSHALIQVTCRLDRPPISSASAPKTACLLAFMADTLRKTQRPCSLSSAVYLTAVSAGEARPAPTCRTSLRQLPLSPIECADRRESEGVPCVICGMRLLMSGQN
eukprot:1466311-Rhodomonas_salina.1